MKSIIIKCINKYKKNKFVRNVFAVASGTVAAQFINILLSPIITRIYGPEAFGVLGVFNSVLNIFVPVVALTLPIAIVLPKEEEEAITIAKVSFKIVILISILVAISLIVSKNFVVKILSIELLSSYLWLIPITMLLSGSLQISQQWAVRNKLFSLKAKTQVIVIIFTNIFQILFGLVNPSAFVLLIIHSVGQGLHAFILVWKEKLAKLLISSHKQNDTVILKRYIDFPLYRAPQMLINGVSQSLPVIILTYFYGPSAAGFYAIGKKVLGLPSQIIGQAIGDVFYPHINDVANSKSSITNSIIKATMVLFVVGIIPFGLIFAYGPQLFGFVFGKEWIQAGEYARWLSLWSFFLFINNPSVRALPVLSAQRFHLSITIISIFIRAAALIVGGLYYSSDIICIILYSITSALINIYIIFGTIRKSKRFDESRR